MGSGLRGRDAELARLAAVVDDAVAGTGRVVLVCGEAGIGKSRLAAAAAVKARDAGLRVLTGRTTEDDGAPPHWPWLQVLAPLEAQELLLAPAGADPEADRFGRQVAVTRVLTDRPTLVLVEDVHRADGGSLRLLAHLGQEAADRGCVLLVTFRPSPADRAPGVDATLDALARGPWVERLDLTGLDLAAVRDLLGPAGSPENATRVLEVSDGNPLLVGELARHLAAGGALDAVPRSVRDSVQLRLRARSEGCVDAVGSGALLGREFAAAVVAQAIRRPLAGVLAGLDEAVDAGLLEVGGCPGDYRFPHALVRDAVAGGFGATERAERHRALAEAIEALEGAGEHTAADLARHWDAASALGDRETAARWCQTAAEVADRRLAWDEAARLYDRALELGGLSDPVAVCHRALGAARARLHADTLAGTVERCLLAGRTAVRAGLAEAAAEAVLVPESRGVQSRELYDLGRQALASLDPSSHALRARLHGQLTNLGFYLDQSTMEADAHAAQEQAALAGDPLAELAAVRARHMVCYAPEHAELRLELARRLGDVARQARLPTAAIWEPLWSMDALIELGRLPEARAWLPVLRSLVAATGTPISRWHLERSQTHLAQAAGRFEDAVRHAEAARCLYRQLEDPTAGEVIYLSQMMWIAMHAGEVPGIAERMAAVPLDLAPALLGDMPLVAAAEACLRLGDRDRALSVYHRVGPARGWYVTPHLGLYPWAIRLKVAATLGLADDLEALLAEVARYRGRHVGSNGGMVSYLGTMELWTGTASAALGRWDDADRDLAHASAVASSVGTPGFAVHADVERAQVLLRRGRPGDDEQVAALLAVARPVAARLGMPGFLARIDALGDALAAGTGAAGGTATPDDGVGPLSAREAQVAALVADGCTNREIARTLVISERTAQNHVQHILTKLCLNSRRDVASWYRSAVRAGDRQGASR